MLHSLLVVLASLLLPTWLSLIFAIPLLMILAFGGIVPPIFTFGDADIHIFDLIIPIVALRITADNALRRRGIHIHPVYSVVVLFLITLLVTTLIAYYKLGREIFISEMVSFLRFLSQISVCFLLAHSLRTAQQLNIVQKWVGFIGYVIAASIYFTLVLRPIGFQLGEVQATETTVRYFGPLGDQVGFILLFGFFKEFLAHKVLGTLFFGGALVATGTAGALVALGVGLMALVIHMQKSIGHVGRRAFPLLGVFCVSAGVLMWWDLGSLRSRLESGVLFSFSGMQRLLAIEIALEIFLDNFFTGVGYTGFRYMAYNYGGEEMFFEQVGGFTPNYVATTGNQYLQIAADGGICALLSFFGMVMIFLRTLKTRMRDLSRERDIFFGAGYIWLVSLMIGNQTAVWLTPSSLIGYLLWIILALAVAARRFSEVSQEGEGQVSSSVAVPRIKQ